MANESVTSKNPSSDRLLSLDVLRGLTILGMVIVNDPGDWSYIYAPLRHADWHGVTPTDFVFPFFLFVVGVSIVLAYTKRLKTGGSHGEIRRKIFQRSLTIFLLGLFLAIFPQFDWGALRIPGVLQRIAIVFFVCSLMFLALDWKKQAWVAGVLLFGYWLAMTLIPVPVDDVIREALASGEIMRAHGSVQLTGLRQLGDSFIAPNYLPGVNLAAWLDRQLIPGRLYEKTWDPEGLLSTLPSLGTGILGMLAGHVLTSKQTRQDHSFTLLFAGFLSMLMGMIGDWFFPFNKNLWSSSFVLYTAGLASMTLGSLVWILDTDSTNKIWNGWTYVPRVFGANAITAYVIHGTIGDLFVIPLGSEGPSIKSAFMDGFEAAGLDRTFVSLLWAILYTAIVFLPVWLMYQKKIFVKL